MNIKDVNILERLLPNQNATKEMSNKQVDAGFKGVYENRLQQNNQTATARLEKQTEKRDERVRAKLENTFENKEVFGSRNKESLKEVKQPPVKEQTANESSPVSKGEDKRNAGNKVKEVTSDDSVEMTKLPPKAEKTETTEEAKPLVETEAVEETPVVEEETEDKSPLAAFMLLVLQAIEDMTTKISALQQNATVGSPEETVLNQIEQAIETLKGSLPANSATLITAVDADVVKKFTDAVTAIQTFNETIKDILKALPQSLKTELDTAVESDSKGQSAVVKGLLQDIKEALKSPLTQLNARPILEKLDHVEGKTEKWIEQEIRKMMETQKNPQAIKAVETTTGEKPSKDVVLETVPKDNEGRGTEKNNTVTAAHVNNASQSKAKSDGNDQRVVHLEQIGTPIDKQIVKIIEKNTESQILFKSILSQVQEGVKSTLKVTTDSSEMVMKLKPETLGDVSVKITVHKNSVIAEMTVQSQIVKEALESSLMDLKTSLKDKGFDVSQINVNVGHDQQSKGNQHSNQSQRRSSRYNKGLDAIGTDTTIIDQVKTFIQNGRMDYFA